jgi:hypothetical protein
MDVIHLYGNAKDYLLQLAQMRHSQYQTGEFFHFDWTCKLPAPGTLYDEIHRKQMKL